MSQSKSFVKKTRAGKVVKVVKEVYLREDLPCGLENCYTCAKYQQENSTNNYLQATAPEIIIIDTNVALHQIDLLEHASFKNVVLLGTVMEEVQHRSRHLYSRLQQILNSPNKHFYHFSNEFHKETYVERLAQETPNDRNDRAIRIATQWYTKHLKPRKIILLTNDMDNLAKANESGLISQTIHNYIIDYVKRFPTLENSNMVDMLVDPSSASQMSQEDKINFTEYKAKNEIEAGIKSGNLYQGPLRMNRDNCFEGRIPCEALNDDILIQGLENLNRAINGDIVVVELLPKDKWTKPSSKIMLADEAKETEDSGQPEVVSMMPSGKIVGIIKHNWRPYPGTLVEQTTNNNSLSVLFQPLDGSIPRIRLKTRQVSNLIGKRLVVCIDDWDSRSRYPSGHYVRTLGAVGDVEVETEALLIQHDVPYLPFSDTILSSLPSAQWTPEKDPDSKNPKRVDFRDIDIFSVDPPGCTDIDDALHIHELPNGNFQVGVHIADVSHFVKEGTPLDQEAAKRGTTVYLVNKRIDMLPKVLGENLCSIMSDVERFAFSVVWEIRPNDAEIVSTLFCKSVIRSRAAMTYEQAQLRIDDTRQNDNITVSLRNLNKLAKILKKKRNDQGALTLASPQVKFIKDEETQNPIDIEMYQMRDTNSMVEEFMLLANISVAKKIYESYPSFALLRRHPHPNARYFESVLQSLKRFNLTLDLTSSKTLSDSLDLAKVDDPYFNTLLRILITRCMTQAVYFSSGSVPYDSFQHYGLATPIYTHFTSPIRRYADLVVHRLLSSAISVSPLSNVNNHIIQHTADDINKRHHMAQYASRSSVNLHTLIFFKQKKEICTAYITRVKANGFSVFIPKYGIEGIVYLNESNESTFIFDDKNQTLISTKDPNQQLYVFGKLQIEISVDEAKQRLKLEWIKSELGKKRLLETNEDVTSKPPQKSQKK